MQADRECGTPATLTVNEDVSVPDLAQEDRPEDAGVPNARGQFFELMGFISRAPWVGPDLEAADVVDGHVVPWL